MEENLPNPTQNVETPPQEVTPVADPQSQPVEEKPTQKRKLSAIKIIMFIIILLLLCVLGYMVYQNNQLKSQISYKPTETPTPSLEPIPTTDPTVDWELYSNERLGFSIRYPSELDYLYDQLDKYPQASSGNLLIQNYDGSHPRDEDLTDFQIAITVRDDPGEYLEIVGEQVPIKIDGVMGIKAKSISKYEEVTTVFLLKSGILYTFQLTTPNSTNVEWFDQILPTFRFTDTISEFVCPDTKVIDCTPCDGGPCPLMFPAYCSKGSAQYNWIVENCPDVTFVGLE